MAFCNSCGAALDPGTRFCNKCGAAVVASSVAPPPRPAPSPVSATPSSFASTAPRPLPPAPPASQGSSSALKIILIVVGVIILIGVLGLGTLGFIGWRIAKSAHVTQNGNKISVDTHFGNVTTFKDPEEAARELGVEVYPGAELQRDGAASVNIMGMHTVTAHYHSSDSLDQVSAFYKSKYPNATVSACDSNSCNIVASDSKGGIVLKMTGDGSGTRIEITHTSRPS